MSELNSQHEKRPPAGRELAEQAFEMVAQLQRDLDVLRDQLAWSNRLSQVGLLATALAHETNNLLTPMRSFAELALAQPGNTALAERALRAAIQASGKAARLADRVMSFGSPQDVEVLATCRPLQVIEESLACLLPFIKQYGVQLVTRVEDVGVRIDSLSLEQVVVNLVANACQAMEKQPGRRQILIASEQRGDSFILSVRDTGPGVPEALRDHLFDPFISGKRGDHDSCISSVGGLGRPMAQDVNASGGAGLGLSICRQLVESACGQIVLAQTSAQGSTFEITLPLG